MKKGEFDDAIEVWLFSDDRKEGDYEKIETSFGWHLVYYEKQGDVVWKADAADALSAEKFDAEIEAELQQNPTEINNFGYSLVKDK